MKSILSSIVLSLLFSAGLKGQYLSIKTDKLTMQEGFYGTMVPSLMQDHLGFIWIASVGLYKYDGYRFTAYKDLPGCKNCPPATNYLYKAILEDDIGLIWVLTVDGIKLFDPEMERTVLLLPEDMSENYNFYTGYRFDIIKDTHNNIWASDLNGLVKISYNSRLKIPVTKDLIFNTTPDSIFTIKHISLSPDIKSEKNRVLSIYEDKWGDIWVGTDDGLFLFKSGTDSFFRIDSDSSDETRLAGKIVLDILQDDDDSFWIATTYGLTRITNIKRALHGNDQTDISLLDFSWYLKGTGATTSLMKDRSNNLLIGTRYNFFRMKKDGLKGDFSFVPVYHLPYVKGVSANTYGVSAIMQDKAGEIWVAHDYNCLMKFNLEKSNFTSYAELVKNKYEYPDILSMFEDNRKNLWVGSNETGLYRIAAEDNNVQQFDPGVSKRQVLCIIQTEPDVLMLGINKGIIGFNMSTGQFYDPLGTSVSELADILRKTAVNSLLKDSDNIYISTDGGIFVFNCLTRKLLRTFLDNNDSIPGTTNQFLSLLKSDEGEIWVTSVNKGICRINYNEEKGTLSLIPFESREFSKFNVLNSPNISLHQDKNGILWLGNGHLQKINLKTGEIRTFKLTENIYFIGVVSILEDDSDNLWLGTGSGLCRFNKITESATLYMNEDGLPIQNHHFLTAFRNKDGLMYFGGIGGFYSFHPDSIKPKNTIPQVVITDFRLFNKSVKIDSSKSSILNKNISYTSSIELRHNQNDLSFEFVVLDYNQPLENKFAYKLEGYNDSWIQTDAGNRVAAYTNLNPGTYTFRVKGANSDGIWNEEATSLSIIIHKPWWSTFLAWFIYFTLFVSVVSLYIQWRLKWLKREKEGLENIVHERTQQLEIQKEEILTQKDLLVVQNQKITDLDHIKSRFFTNISHEFRTPLSLIQGPVEEMLDNPRRNEKERRKLNIVYRNARRLLNLVNQLLDISKIDSSKMKLELTEADVMKYLRAITAAFNSLAETREINYKCQFPTEQIITWFDPDKCEKIVSNLLSNAFKFTPKGGRILFTANYILNQGQTSPLLNFSVEDTGPGIPSASLEKIFDRFYQVEESIKKETGGTGIGLSLARDMARLMHGDINVKSEEGKGSTFSVHFPIGKEHLKPDEYIVLSDLPESEKIIPLSNDDSAVDPDQEDELSHQKPIILIVEDNFDIRVQLAENLQSKYNIRHASDGVVGLKKAFDLIPDLVITDLMMPFMDGTEMCSKLKTDERTSHIPVIMLTAKVTTEDKIAGLHTGADDYISKPFHMAELKARVENLIEQRKKLRERFSREVTLQLSDISVTPIDEKFLSKAVSLVEKHLNDELFDLPKFRYEMNMSSSTLFRKLHALTNQSPSEFIRTLRLKRAASLLSQNFGNVTQVSLEVGFNNLSYFNKSFRNLFKVSPTEYVKSIQKK